MAVVQKMVIIKHLDTLRNDPQNQEISRICQPKNAIAMNASNRILEFDIISNMTIMHSTTNNIVIITII